MIVSLATIVVLIALIDVAAALWLAPHVQRKIITAVGERFESDLEVKRVAITLLPSVYVAADDVVFVITAAQTFLR